MLIRSAIRILLINQNNKLLLMRVVDPSTMLIGGKARPVFWCTIGGKIETDESIEQAAYRELYEETGLTNQDVTFGPIVWYGRHQMIISGQHTELDEKFIVCHKKSSKELAHDNFTENEKSVVTSLEWLSLEEIVNHTDPIFPVILKTKLPGILNLNYPPAPEWVDLALQS